MGERAVVEVQHPLGDGLDVRGGHRRDAIRVLEERLDGRDWLAGDFSLADIFFGPTLHYLNTLPEGARLIAAAPRVAAYLKRLSARPAFQATFPPPLPARAA